MLVALMQDCYDKATTSKSAMRLAMPTNENAERHSIVMQQLRMTVIF